MEEHKKITKLAKEIEEAADNIQFLRDLVKHKLKHEIRIINKENVVEQGSKMFTVLADQPDLLTNMAADLETVHDIKCRQLNNLVAKIHVGPMAASEKRIA